MVAKYSLQNNHMKLIQISTEFRSTWATIFPINLPSGRLSSIHIGQLFVNSAM